MASLPISGLPAASALADADLFPLVQGGVTKRSSLAAIRAAIAAFDPTNPIDRFAHPVKFYEDFGEFPVSGTSPGFPADWYSQTQGTGAAASIINAGSNGTDRNGVLQLSTGTTTTGIYCAMKGYNQNWDKAQGPFSLGVRIKLPLLPSVAEDFIYQVGLLNDKAANASGIWFSADLAHANWQCGFSPGPTLVDSGVAVPVDTFQCLSIKCPSLNAAATEFWIDGVKVATVDCSGGAGGQYAVGFRIVKSAGTTARVAQHDCAYADLQNTVRAAWPNPI
jgi:hypothetical protein